MAQKKSVDEIWKELNARPVHRPRPAAADGAASMTIPGLGTIKRVPPPTKTPLQEDARVEELATSSAASSQAAPQLRSLQHYDPLQAGVSAEQLATYISSIQRLVNCLSDPDRSTRRQAASTLLTKLTMGDASTPAASAGMLQALVCGPLLAPMLGLLRDVVEQCRIAAVQLWSHAVAHVADLAPLVPRLVPEVARRMGHMPVMESAEEVRLSLTQLVGAVVGRSPPGSLVGVLPDLVLTLCRAQEDPYHEIKKAGAAATAALARAIPATTLLPHGSKLAPALVASLSHPHSRVRAAALDAIDALAAAGALTPQTVHDLIAPGLRPVAYDRTPAVREALFTAIARWLGGVPATTTITTPGVAPTSVPEPSEQNVVDLLMILLVGVSDPQRPVATLALQLVESVGAAFQQRTQQTLAAGTDMQVDGQATAAHADGSGTDVIMQPVEDSESGRSSAELSVAACQLGPPYQGRPGAGARAMARALLPQLLPPVVSDLTGWTVAQRAAAVRSLHTLLVLAEDAVQAHLLPLLPALCSAVSDEDVEVAGCVVRCAHAVGAHVQATRWLPLVMDHLINSRLSAAARANGLVVLAALLHSAGAAQQPLPAASLASLATTLASDDLRGALLAGGGPPGATTAVGAAGAAAAAAPGEAAAARAQLLAVTSNLMRWQGAACAAVAGPLLTLLLALWGAQGDAPAAPAPVGGMQALSGSAAQRNAVEAALHQLVVCCGAGSLQGLLDAHAEEQLQGVLATLHSWTPDSGGFLVLRALLLTAGAPTLARLAPALLHALHPLLSDAEASPTLRLAVLQLLDGVLDSPDKRGAGLAGDAAGGLLLEKALLPPLTWRAGKTAAAVRYAAVTALASALRRGLLPAKPLMRLVGDGTLLPLLAQELDEDWYVDVRHAACYVVQQLLLVVGPRLGHDPRRTLYIELLKRLDDSSNTVRVAACGALHAFCTTLPRDYCETNTGYLAAGVVIHMDDADTQVQEAACGVLEALGRVKPQATAVEVLKVKDRFRNKHCCDRVLLACAETATAPSAQAPTPPVGAPTGAPAAGAVALDTE